MAEQDKTTIRRAVYYFQGYDPRGARFYARMISSEIRGYLGSAGARFKASQDRTDQTLILSDITIQKGDRDIRTRINFLQMDDFLKRFVIRGSTRLCLESLRKTSIGVFRGNLFREFRLNSAWPGIQFEIYVMPLVIALLACWGLYSVAARYAGIDVPPLAFLPVAALVYWLVFLLNIRMAGLAHLLWATGFKDSMVLPLNQNGENAAEFDAIISAQTSLVWQDLQTEAPDEILFVGHSFGAWTSIRALAQLVRWSQVSGKPLPVIHHLTLGDASGYAAVARGPGGQALRDAIVEAASEPSIVWTDVSGWQDLIATSCFDPVRGDLLKKAGIERPPPLHIGLDYARMLETKYFWRYRWNLRLMHFQYLMPPQRRGVFDFYWTLLYPLDGSPAPDGSPPLFPKGAN